MVIERKAYSDNAEGAAALQTFLNSKAVLRNNVHIQLDSSAFPKNLENYTSGRNFHKLYTFVQEESTPIAYVPKEHIVNLLIHAENKEVRNEIIYQNQNDIIDSCQEELKHTQTAQLDFYARIAHEAAEAIKANYYRAGQALCTANLDSLITEITNGLEVPVKITNQKAATDIISKSSTVNALVWLPVNNAHRHYYPKKGDPVPQYYSRHASVHSVSQEQYTHANSIRSLMLITSLIAHSDVNKIPITYMYQEPRHEDPC